MKKITKAIIPAAGLGTRVLPATKSMPKEMLPLVDKPAIQYIVEEAVNSGITDILIITSRGKGIIEDHFDRSPELEERLKAAGESKKALLDEVLAISEMANISYVRQKETKGLGHAVSCARFFTGDEPFVVMYGDDVILSKKPVCKQLMEAYEEFGRSVVGVQKVSEDDIVKYSSLKVESIHDNFYKCTDMIEKPSKDKILSLFSVLGRCVLTPDVYEILENTAPGAGGEIQLTDAMKVMARNGGITAVDFEGRRYDMGNKLEIMKASVEVACGREDIGSEFKEYIKQIAKTL